VLAANSIIMTEEQPGSQRASKGGFLFAQQHEEDDLFSSSLMEDLLSNAIDGNHR